MAWKVKWKEKRARGCFALSSWILCSAGMGYWLGFDAGNQQFLCGSLWEATHSLRSEPQYKNSTCVLFKSTTHLDPPADGNGSAGNWAGISLTLRELCILHPGSLIFRDFLLAWERSRVPEYLKAVAVIPQNVYVGGVCVSGSLPAYIYI